MHWFVCCFFYITSLSLFCLHLFPVPLSSTHFAILCIDRRCYKRMLRFDQLHHPKIKQDVPPVYILNILLWTTDAMFEKWVFRALVDWTTVFSARILIISHKHFAVLMKHKIDCIYGHLSVIKFKVFTLIMQAKAHYDYDNKR